MLPTIGRRLLPLPREGRPELLARDHADRQQALREGTLSIVYGFETFTFNVSWITICMNYSVVQFLWQLFCFSVLCEYVNEHDNDVCDFTDRTLVTENL